jgi:hypothetical protein
MLTTIDRLKEALGEKSDLDDVRLTRLLTAASEYIEAYCGRDFLSVSHTEYHDGTGTDSLLLRHYPIIGTPAVLESGTALAVGQDPSANPPPEVLIYPEEGRLVRNFGVWYGYHNYYKITYTAGYATVPAAIVQAAIDLASLMAREKDRVGIAATTVGQNTAQLTRALPEHSQRALDLYRDPTVGRAA